MISTRRTLLSAAPILAAPALARAATPDFPAIERASGGKLGVFAIETGSAATLSWRADGRFPFCSTFKGPLAAFVLSKIDRGQLRLDQSVPYGQADLLPYAPVTRAHVAEGAMTLETLCAAAVSASDNTAANLLLRLTGGPAALTAWMRSLGDTAFQLSFGEPELNRSHFGDLANTTTPRAMAQSYRRLVLGDVLTTASRAKLIAWMIANTTGGKRLRAGLPAGWRVGDKTGTYGGAWFSIIDVAVAWPVTRPPLVISGFVADSTGFDASEAALAEVARQVSLWAIAHG